MLKTKSEFNVNRKARPLAVELMVLEISHSSSSTNTADSPMLAENTEDATLCTDGRNALSVRLGVARFQVLWLNTGRPGFGCPSLLSAGNNLRCAMTAVAIHVTTNGVNESTTVDGGTLSSRRSRWAGRQSSQSSSVGKLIR